MVIEDGLAIAGKPLRDHYEAAGHSDAFDHMYALSEGKTVTEEDIKKLHALFYHRIKEEGAGSYRKVQAIITGSQYPLPRHDALPGMMRKFIQDLPGLKKAIIRLCMPQSLTKNLCLFILFLTATGVWPDFKCMQAGYIIAIIPPLKRVEYIAALEKAHKDDADFIKLTASCVYETQKDLLRMFNGKI